MERSSPVRALVQRQARSRHGVARSARTVEVREVSWPLRAEALRPLALRHVLITLCEGRLTAQAARCTSVAKKPAPVQTRGTWVRTTEVAPKVGVMLVRVVASGVAVVRLLTTEETVHRLSLQPPCVQLGVAARVKAVGLHVQPQDRGFTQSAYGRVHRARRGPGVERRSLKVGVHAQSGFVKVPLALASVPAVDLGLELVQPKHTWLGAGGSIGHDSLLRGAPRASYSLQPGSGAPGRYHRGEAQRSPPPRRARALAGSSPLLSGTSESTQAGLSRLARPGCLLEPCGGAHAPGGWHEWVCGEETWRPTS